MPSTPLATSGRRSRQRPLSVARLPSVRGCERRLAEVEITGEHRKPKPGVLPSERGDALEGRGPEVGRSVEVRATEPYVALEPRGLEPGRSEELRSVELRHFREGGLVEAGDAIEPASPESGPPRDALPKVEVEEGRSAQIDVDVTPAGGRAAVLAVVRFSDKIRWAAMRTCHSARADSTVIVDGTGDAGSWSRRWSAIVAHVSMTPGTVPHPRGAGRGGRGSSGNRIDEGGT
jgi:hypothetical protein